MGEAHIKSTQLTLHSFLCFFCFLCLFGEVQLEVCDYLRGSMMSTTGSGKMEMKR